MELGLSERWVLLADVTNSTQFFWELCRAREKDPDALFKSSNIYASSMEGIFKAVEKLPQNNLAAQPGNTTGDGFILLGRHGHGDTHIRADAIKLLLLGKSIKEICDDHLSKARQKIDDVLSQYQASRSLPKLKMKVTINHGYFVTVMRSQRFFGDTINYCSRVASAAFENRDEGIVLTKKFANVLPEPLRSKVKACQHEIEICYPKKRPEEDTAYRISLSQSDIWSEIEQLDSATSKTMS